MKPARQLVSTAEAARVIGVTPQHVATLVSAVARKGKGNASWFDVRDVERVARERGRDVRTLQTVAEGELLAPTPKRPAKGHGTERARDVIREALRDGPRLASEVRELAERAGVPARFLHNARVTLGLRVEPRPGRDALWSAPPSGLRQVERQGEAMRRLHGSAAKRAAPTKLLDRPLASFVVLVDRDGVELARARDLPAAMQLAKTTRGAVAAVADDGRTLAFAGHSGDEKRARAAARLWLQRQRDPGRARPDGNGTAIAAGNGAGGLSETHVNQGGTARPGTSIARTKGARERAVTLVRELLAAGPRASGEVFAATAAEGISRTSTCRAARSLGVVTVGRAPGHGGAAILALPDNKTPAPAAGDTSSATRGSSPVSMTRSRRAQGVSPCPP